MILTLIMCISINFSCLAIATKRQDSVRYETLCYAFEDQKVHQNLHSVSDFNFIVKRMKQDKTLNCYTKELGEEL